MILLKTEADKNKFPYYLYAHIRLDTNQPFYIGVGGKSRKETFEKYYRASEKGSRRNKIWNDIKNKTSYYIKIILHSDSLKEIYQKEIEFISLYGRIDDKTGILSNMCAGGEGIARKIYKKENYVNQSKLMKINNPNFSGNSFRGNCKPILQYDLEGNFIREWESFEEIRLYFEKNFNYKHSAIRACCNKKAKSSLGFYWTYQLNNNEIKDKIQIPVDNREFITAIDQYDLDGNFIKTFKSCLEASKVLKVNRISISNCCKNKLKSYKGFNWEYNKNNRLLS
jgi:hypothetical protein